MKEYVEIFDTLCIYSSFNITPLNMVLLKFRLSWFEHLMRMENVRWSKSIWKLKAPSIQYTNFPIPDFFLFNFVYLKCLISFSFFYFLHFTSKRIASYTLNFAVTIYQHISFIPFRMINIVAFHFYILVGWPCLTLHCSCLSLNWPTSLT